MQLFLNQGRYPACSILVTCYGAVLESFGHDYQYNSSMQENKSPRTFF